MNKAAEAGKDAKALISDKPLSPSEVSDGFGVDGFKVEPVKGQKIKALKIPQATKSEEVLKFSPGGQWFLGKDREVTKNVDMHYDNVRGGQLACAETLTCSANGQWNLTKGKPQTAEELAAFKAKRDKYLREKHGLPNKEEHEKQLDASRKRDVPKSAKPDMSHRADAKYKEGYHSATRETAPGKFVYQGMPKPPPKDISPPISKKPGFHGGGFERSPVRMSPSVKRR